MKSTETKDQLIAAATALLLENEKPETITSRQIATRAGANLAMINYYFKSKDELLNLVIGRIIADSADDFLYSKDTEIPPKERMRKMLYELSETVVKYNRYTKIYMPYILLHEEITVPFYIIPMLKEYFGEQRNELQCKVIAYQLISFIQLIYFRSDAFFRYSGADVMDAETRKNLIDIELNLFLGEKK